MKLLLCIYCRLRAWSTNDFRQCHTAMLTHGYSYFLYTSLPYGLIKLTFINTPHCFNLVNSWLNYSCLSFANSWILSLSTHDYFLCTHRCFMALPNMTHNINCHRLMTLSTHDLCFVNSWLSFVFSQFVNSWLLPLHPSVSYGLVKYDSYHYLSSSHDSVTYYLLSLFQSQLNVTHLIHHKRRKRFYFKRFYFRIQNFSQMVISRGKLASIIAPDSLF